MSEQDQKKVVPVEKSFCGVCSAPGELIGIGTASSRRYFRCTKCGKQWIGERLGKSKFGVGKITNGGVVNE